ncbi:MAG: hypothetical protein ACOC3T_03130, partial [Bacteroidota bacterium]
MKSINFKQSIVFTIGLLLSIISLSLSAADLHVGSGQTYSTVQAAVDDASSGDVIIIHAGTYREEVNIDVSNITIRAKSGDEVTMNGCEALLSWTDEGSGVYSTTMDWDIDEDRQENQIFVDGKMIHVARWPNENDDIVVDANRAQMDEVERIDEGTRETDITDSEVSSEPDARWVGAKIYINLSNPTNQKDGQGYTGIVDDKSGSVITTKTTTDYTGIKYIGDENWGVDKDSYYFLYDPTPSAVSASGGVEALLDKGEWWKDGNTLYVKTPDGEAPASSLTGDNLVEAKKYPFCFRPQGSSGYLTDVTIKGLKLFATSITTDNDYSHDADAPLSSSSGVVIDSIHAKYVYHTYDCRGQWQHYFNGRSGIILTGEDHELKNSIIVYSAGSGISLTGKRHYIYNNIIHDVNYMIGESGAINNGTTGNTVSEDHEIAYNTIYNTPHCAISIRTLENSDANNKGVARIHHNYIYNTLT